jgi:hypothetical protein
VRGVRELFDSEFPVWSTSVELSEGLGQLTSDPARCRELAGRYQATILAEHTYAHRARRLRRLTQDDNRALSFCLKIGAPDWSQAERWGDLHFAIGLGRALRRRGHRWRVDVLPDWDTPVASGFDVAVHLRGLTAYEPAPGQFNVLWLISHPDKLDPAEAAAYDLVCVASEPFAQRLAARTSVPVRVLDQATDPRMFFPDPRRELAHDLVFAGNSRGTRRKLLDDLLPTDRDLAIWGQGWEGTPAQRHLRGEHIPNHELRQVYSSAAIVLCDHWPDMRAAGFRANRIYDALACGALVVSDRVAGIDGSPLGEGVLTYEEPEELEALLERLLAEGPEARAGRVRGAHERVLAHETFDARARDLLEWVRAGAAERQLGRATTSR